MVTIHAEVGKDKFVQPMLYILLVNKKKKMYVRVLKVIKNDICNNEFNPKIWCLDFEYGFLDAVRIVFGVGVILLCCYFHLCQSIRRHAVTKLGLKKDLKEDPNLALQLRMFMSLAFVPIEHLQTAFEALTNPYYLDPRLKPLARYFRVSY